MNTNFYHSLELDSTLKILESTKHHSTHYYSVRISQYLSINYLHVYSVKSEK